jgi:uncharacterized protein (TIGR00645 family)
MDDRGIKKEEEQSFFERIGESALWSTRYIILFGVICSVIASIALFLVGSYEIIEALRHNNPFSDNPDYRKDLVVGIIGGVDLYLIGVVLMIFGFGIYELFISKIDIARKNLDVTILEIENLDELKQKIIKVIIMVLIVTFFERVLQMSYDTFSTPMDMLWFAVSIFALSFGVYLIRKDDPHNKR